MKELLIKYFGYFEYDAEDMDFFIGIYDKISSDSESLSLWQRAIEMYEENEDCDYDEILKLADRVADRLHISEYCTEWLIFFCLIPVAHKKFIDAGISEQIFRDTMMDLKFKLTECKLVKGVRGFFAALWFPGFFRLKRFALGRLQFEIINFGKHYDGSYGDLTPETRVINIHIPRDGAPLSPEAVDAALFAAREFYRAETDGNGIFVCYSWLLFPENADILPPHTNIHKFMKRFEIIRSGTYKDNIDLWRLFDTDEKHPDRLPADTSARRAYIDHLKRGGKTGWGYGILRL